MNSNNNEYQLLDIDGWSRKQHFQFYRTFAQPHFNICCNLNAEKLFKFCKASEISFFDAYIYLSMCAVNQIESFRYRLAGNEVRIYKQSSIGVIQLADNDTIRFSEMPYTDSFVDYQKQAVTISKQAKKEEFFSENFIRDKAIKNTIYISVIPWISFTSFKHARHGEDKDGIPLFVFGKMNKSDFSMPFSVEVNHSLMDGLHVGQLVELLQKMFNDPEQHLGPVELPLISL